MKAIRIPDGFAVDIGGTKIAAARFENGLAVAQERAGTDGGASPETLVETVSGLLERLGYRRGDRFGLATAGWIDAAGNWGAVNLNTLRKVRHVPLKSMIEEVLGPVTLVNDAAAATLAEAKVGAGRGLLNFAFLTVSTGVGGGLVLNGLLHRTADGVAGNLGFMSSTFGNVTCGSGRFGTVESAASGRAIARMAGEAGHAGVEPRDVFEAALAGEGWADRIVDLSAAAVAELCGDLRAALGLEAIAIGGSVGFARTYVSRVQKHLTSLPPLFHCPLQLAEAGPDGPMIGALLATMEF